MRFFHAELLSGSIKSQLKMSVKLTNIKKKKLYLVVNVAEGVMKAVAFVVLRF